MQEESKDPAIKLFGKRIHLPADGEIFSISVDDFDKAKCMSDDEEEKDKTQ
ncbi:dof zinc finger protein DOF3.3-like protein [Corchorus olitorius]|uniref:Dof zinc finger protein DOF3.3-like protein n=1 Tax=Corchorus olitorius TaxID=93759 RepID=A0A1R3FZD3_9ROSI|nr:dof zinc finger protein DOF3.3-like protein [Corchorus olitorius]